MICAIGPWQWQNDGMGFGWASYPGSVPCPDLRPPYDCGLAGTHGDWPWSLFLFPDGKLPDDYYSLGTGRIDELKPDTAARKRWGECFGAEPNGDTVADWLTWQLTDGSDPTGATPCKSLLPTHLRVCEIHVPWHSVLRKWKFGEWNPSGNPYHNRVRQLLQRDMAETIVSVEAERNDIDKATKALAKENGGGQKEKEERTKKLAWYAKRAEQLAKHPAKVLGGLVLKYRCDAADITREVGPEPPTTTISDDFTRSDGTGIGNQLTWAVSGTWSTTSNRALLRSTGDVRYARAESDLSSSDHYAQTVNYGLDSWYAQCGQAVRVSSSANTCYIHEQSRYSSFYSYWVKHVNGTRTTLANGNDGGLPNADGDTGKGQCSGSGLAGFLNGGAAETVTDSAISSGTRTGMWQLMNNTSVFPAQDNFEAADLFAGSPYYYFAQQ